LSVPWIQREEWVNNVLGLGAVAEDGPELPAGCTPYLPCPVDVLLRAVEEARIEVSDTFVDVGSGVGRALALVHLLSGATAVGIEIQPALVQAAAELSVRLPHARIATVAGDAGRSAGALAQGTVFFLYCPFGGERLVKVLADLEQLALARPIRVCCVNLPLPSCSWLRLEGSCEGDLSLYRSVLPPSTTR